MPREMEFDFTDEELYSAFRLSLPEDEARREARRVVNAVQPGMDWATSEETLILLSLGSETGAEKVERLRKEDQDSRRQAWMRERGDVREPLERAWEELVRQEDQEWAARQAAMRCRLSKEQ